MKPRLLDLFCGEGGAAEGYHRAGFEVVGVDINPQPNYPFEFVQADALEFLDGGGFVGFDVVHASPPCQRHSTLKTVAGVEYCDLLAQTRALLRTTGLPYVIENVVGAPLVDPVRVCGTSLGCRDGETELRRHRLFEANFPIEGAPCRHDPGLRPVGVYGDLGVNDRPNRPMDGPTGPHGWKAGRERARALMGINWMTDRGLAESIPPRYTEWIGWQLFDHVRRINESA